MRKPKHFIFARALAALLTLAAAGCSKQARMARYLEQANRHFQSDQYDKAEVEYLNVLKYEALNAQAISRLGLIYYAQGRFGRSVPFLRKGSELQPENLDLRVKLGMVDIAIGDLKAARDEANFVLDHRPEDKDAPMILADVAARPEEIQEARARLDALPGAGDSAPVQVALGALFLKEQKPTEAEAYFKRAQSLDPKLGAPSMALGNLYWGQKKLPEAEEEFRKAAELAPPRSAVRLQYAQFKIRTGDLDAGKKYLEEMTRKTPDYLPALTWLAEIALAEKKYDDCAALIEKALARDALHPEAMLLDARLKMAKGQNDKAVAGLERMLATYPKSPGGYYHLGLAYAALGDSGKAVDSLKQALAYAPGFAEAEVLLAGLNIQKGDLSSAVVGLKHLVQQRPDIAQARLLLAQAYRAQGNLDDALAVYRQLEKDYAANPQTPLMIGLVLLQQNKRTEARESFNRALEVTPQFLPAIEQLVKIDLMEKKFPDARQRVDALISTNPKAPEPHLLLAKIFEAQQDTVQAESTLKKIIELAPDSPTAYFLLAQLYIKTNQVEKALANLREVVAKNPKDTTALMITGVINDQQKKYDDARNAYEKVLDINPRFSPALNNLAYLYSEHFDLLDKAYEMAQKARELLPHEPNTADTLGWILYKRRQYPWALSLLQESAGRLPDEAEIQYHLGMTYYMMGAEAPARAALQRAIELPKDYSGKAEAKERLAILALDPAKAGPAARAELEKAAAERKDDPVVLARLGALYERDGAIDKAMDAYQAALQVSPSNVTAMINQVRLYQTLGKTAKAIELAKEARKLEPEDPGVAHTLGLLVFQTGEYSWAASLLQEAARKLSDDPDVVFDAAKAAYSVGRVADAEAGMRLALSRSNGTTGAAFSRADEARHFLEMTALAADPARAAVEEARIGLALTSNPLDVPALMAKAAAEESKSDAAVAMQTYDKVLAQYPNFAPAKRRLAIIYAEHPGDDQKAFELALKAREAFPGDTELGKAFGIILYRRGDSGQAANLLQESIRARSDDAVLWYYLGMARHRLNRAAESKEALERALELGLTGDPAAEARKILEGKN